MCVRGGGCGRTWTATVGEVCSCCRWVLQLLLHGWYVCPLPTSGVYAPPRHQRAFVAKCRVKSPRSSAMRMQDVSWCAWQSVRARVMVEAIVTASSHAGGYQCPGTQSPDREWRNTIWIVRPGREARMLCAPKHSARKARFFPQLFKFHWLAARHRISNFKHQHLLASL